MRAEFDRRFIDGQVRSYKDEMSMPEVWDLYDKTPPNGPAFGKRIIFESYWIALRSIGLTDEEIARVEPIMARRTRLLYIQRRFSTGQSRGDDMDVFRADHAADKKDVQRHLAEGRSIPQEVSFVMQMDLDTDPELATRLGGEAFKYADFLNQHNLKKELGGKYDAYRAAQDYAYQAISRTAAKIVEDKGGKNDGTA